MTCGDGASRHPWLRRCAWRRSIGCAVISWLTCSGPSCRPLRVRPTCARPSIWYGTCDYLAALAEYAAILESAGLLEQSALVAQRLIAADPLVEDAHVRL